MKVCLSKASTHYGIVLQSYCMKVSALGAFLNMRLEVLCRGLRYCVGICKKMTTTEHLTCVCFKQLGEFYGCGG